MHELESELVLWSTADWMTSVVAHGLFSRCDQPTMRLRRALSRAPLNQLRFTMRAQSCDFGD